MCVQESTQARRGSLILNWSCRQLWQPCWVWELSPGPVQKQLVLSTLRHLSDHPIIYEEWGLFCLCSVQTEKFKNTIPVPAWDLLGVSLLSAIVRQRACGKTSSKPASSPQHLIKLPMSSGLPFSTHPIPTTSQDLNPSYYKCVKLGGMFPIHERLGVDTFNPWYWSNLQKSGHWRKFSETVELGIS